MRSTEQKRPAGLPVGRFFCLRSLARSAVLRAAGSRTGPPHRRAWNGSSRRSPCRRAAVPRTGSRACRRAPHCCRAHRFITCPDPFLTSTPAAGSRAGRPHRRAPHAAAALIASSRAGPVLHSRVPSAPTLGRLTACPERLPTPVASRPCPARCCRAHRLITCWARPLRPRVAGSRARSPRRVPGTAPHTCRLAAVLRLGLRACRRAPHAAATLIGSSHARTCSPRSHARRLLRWAASPPCAGAAPHADHLAAMRRTGSRVGRPHRVLMLIPTPVTLPPWPGSAAALIAVPLRPEPAAAAVA